MTQGVVTTGTLGQSKPQGGHAGACGAVDPTVDPPVHDTRHDSSLTKPTDTVACVAVGRGPHEVLGRGLIWPNGVGARRLPHPT